MNKMLLVAVMSAIWAGLCTSPVTAQDQTEKPACEKAPALGTTRVAVINLAYIFGKYERAALLKEENGAQLKKAQEEAKRLMEQINGLQTSLQKGEFTNGTKEQYEEKLIEARRRFEDLNRKATTQFGKMQQAQLVSLWADIRAGVKSYTDRHGIELVIAYGEPIQDDSLNTFPNVDRKMRSVDQGGSAPFLMAPGVDISEAVTEHMNKTFRAGRTKTTQK
jgi:Skp family chaperone for outer membrane proteins